jgi:hypothetical protein
MLYSLVITYQLFRNHPSQTCYEEQLHCYISWHQGTVEGLFLPHRSRHIFSAKFKENISSCVRVNIVICYVEVRAFVRGRQFSGIPGAGQSPPPQKKFQSFDKAEPNSQFCRK